MAVCGQEGGLDELDAATVMQQILRGVAYMHNHRWLGSFLPCRVLQAVVLTCVQLDVVAVITSMT